MGGRFLSGFDVVMRLLLGVGGRGHSGSPSLFGWRRVFKSIRIFFNILCHSALKKWPSIWLWGYPQV